MTTIWIAFLFCVNTAACSAQNNSQFNRTFETEEACQAHGEQFLHTTSAPMFKNFGIACIKVMKR